ncbi:MAG: RNA polymerase sigma factor [Flavobacteriales bacterium]|nr:RNA polymerase sigma factor [Flavobacteriales bacterium]
MFSKRSKNKDDALNDEELVSALQKHMDTERFGVLYDRYTTKVYQKCLGMTRDKDLAKDLTHDIFLKAFMNLSKFDHRSKFGTWLYSITYNYCLDTLRKGQRTRSEEIDERIEDGVIDDQAYEAKLLGLRADRLDLVIAQLDPSDRALLLMKYQEDLSVKEIMEVMALQESAVKMRILRARERALRLYVQLYPEEP